MPIADALSKGRLDAAARRAAVEGIERTEARCESIIQSAFAGFAALRASLEKLLFDLRAKKPELVANAQYLNRNRAESLSAIERSAGLLSLCVGLLRRFSVDMSGLGAAVEGA
jgi:hypothetical protein